MNEVVTIPRKEYETLISIKEDMEDLGAVQAYLRNPGEGIPSEFVKRIIDGEHALAVFREWRGYNQSSLAKAAGVNRVQIADIEAGRSSGSISTIKKLANALEVQIDDLV